LRMVYCTKCGTSNPDNAEACSNCGAKLYSTGESPHYRRMENECIGLPHGGAIVGLAIGLIIVFAGIIWLLQQAGVISPSYNAWPLAAIVFGVLIIVAAIYAFRRRHWLS